MYIASTTGFPLMFKGGTKLVTFGTVLCISGKALCNSDMVSINIDSYGFH